jgi:hypothetical protein
MFSNRQMWRILAAGVAISGAAISTTWAGTDLSGPRLRTHEEIFDFGYVPQHAQVAHSFWLYNVGTEMAVIEQVKPNCGCTDAPLADSTVAPGDSTWIEIVFGTGRMAGAVEKHTRVSGSAIGRIPLFTIQAHVLPDSAESPLVTVSPRAAFVDALNPPDLEDGKWNYPITFTNTSNASLELRAVDVPQEFVALSSNTLTIAAGGRTELIMRINPTVSDAAYAKSVTFELSDRDQTRISIPFGNRPEY